MKISVSKTHTEEVTINVPSFWKSPSTYYNEYVAAIDDNTVIKVLLMDDYSAIHSGTPDRMRSELATASNDFNICTEEDFMSAHDEALLGMSLKPVIKSYEQQLRDLMKETNGKGIIPNDAVCDNRS